MVTLNDSDKEKILNSILDSNDFKDSKRYQDLLKYLIDKSEKNESIKEIDIAFDVFGKDSSFDPNTNPLVRSYVSNLRKKLEHYYLTTEDKFEYRIEIPKGQYLVNYISVEKSNGQNKKTKRMGIIYLVIIFSLFIYIVFQQFQISSSSVQFKTSPLILNPVLREFILPNSGPITIVLGDYFFLADKNNNFDRLFLRNTKINSEKDFYQYEKKYPGFYGNFEISKFTYLRTSASFGLLEILRVLGNSNKNLTLQLASHLKWEDLGTHNVIFLGTFKTLYQLDTLINKTNIRFKIEPSQLNIINSKSDTTKSFKIRYVSGNYQNDYSLLLKIPGPNKNTILFCVGFSEIGVMAAVHMAVSPNFSYYLQKYTNKELPKPPLYFEMISRCEGIEMIDMKSEINYFNIIKNGE